jgi:hypothetical protein
MNRIRTVYIGAIALSAMLALSGALAAQGADAAKSQSQVAVSSNAGNAGNAAPNGNDSANLSPVNKTAEAGNVLNGRSEIVGFSRLTGNRETSATPQDKDGPGPDACIANVGAPCGPTSPYHLRCCTGFRCVLRGGSSRSGFFCER